ncbi:TPA: type VI secretion protein VasK [Enterobacter cloacae subsp. cloacae]|nr:type VI secretion protein VasK [Enterobacter cloacae subsp. cloacae]HCM9561715.1 type VI secretion protein VasK [Enterobacter cloacae subsp. cloacae]
MNTSGSLFGRLGRVGIIFVGVAAIWWLITRYGARLGIETRNEQILTLVLLCLGLAFIRYLPAIKKYAQELAHRRKARQENGLPDDESRLVQTPPHNVTVNDIRQTLRHQYGRLWGRRVRILLVTGRVSDVEQLTPGLTSQYWQEDQGTLLLWGGDPAQPEDQTWLTALRRLRHRPADSMVLVTSALGAASSASLTGDALDTLSRGISARYTCLGWRLPLYVWSLQQAGDDAARVTQPVGCLLPARCQPDKLADQLQALVPGLVARGIQQVCGAPQHHFLLMLADRLSNDITSVLGPLSALLNPYRPLPLAGVVFSPATTGGERTVKHHWGRDNRWDAIVETVQALPAGLRPHRPGFSWRSTLAVTVSALMLLWGAGMVVAFLGNRSLISNAQQQARQTLDTRQPEAGRLQALSELQKTISRLQYREVHGAPWYLHAGMNQNAALLAAVLPRYAQGALPLLRDAAAGHLQQQLEGFIQLPPDSPQRSRMAKAAYDQLKLYLMLAYPQRMEPAWFSRTLMRDWPQREGVAQGIWQAKGPDLLAFYGAQSAAHTQWQLPADDGLVSQARTLLVRLMGVRNSDATLYQKMLSQVAHQYADMRLTDMTGDTDAARLFTTDEVVPGMFTRKAWEEAVQPSIDQVAKGRREEMDWVLTDSGRASQQQASPEEVRQRLTARYFADFGGAWLAFLNGLRWQKAETLSDAIDQLTLMADVRQSPLVALMNTLNVQGRTGRTGEAVTDSLVKSARNLLSRDTQPAIDQSTVAHGPLDATFGPVLALMDNQGSDMLSLQTFLTRVTQVRLRLQQVTNSSDPQAMTRTLAQTVFQGKAVDLTATRDYGSLMAAGLGQEWSGFGQTVFVRPMEQAWQQVLSPAAESLNAQWRASVVDEWNSTFGGRYPFKNVSSDVSLPLLAKYLNADSGRITRFLQGNLNGVLHREGSRWVPDSINAQGLNFNPAFLRAVNTLSQIADVVFTNGEAGLHFDLRPGTAAGVMQTDMVIDGQKLTYVNQMPTWKRFTWPADTEAPGAALSWISTQAGTRQYADMPGSWGLIRLLDEADVQPYSGAASSFSVRWKAQDGRLLNYILRTEAGAGPLALLKLRDFVLPDTIFSVSAVPQAEMDIAGITEEGDD